MCATLASNSRPDELSKIEAKVFQRKEITKSTSPDMLIRVIGLRHQKTMLSERRRVLADASDSVTLSIPKYKPHEFTDLVSSKMLGLPASTEDLEMTLLYPDREGIPSHYNRRRHELFVPHPQNDKDKSPSLLIVTNIKQNYFCIRGNGYRERRSSNYNKMTQY